jgi:hypothetical protein
MARNVRQKRKLKAIEKKYDKLIGDMLEEYSDKTMEELWGALDRLKEQMGQEINEIK